MLELTQDNFGKEVLRSAQPVLIDLWAEWCAPCKMIAPIIDEVARDYKGKVRVAKINVDDYPELATELAVMNIPTLIFYKKGKELGRLVGVNTKENIKAKIREFFG